MGSGAGVSATTAQNCYGINYATGAGVNATVAIGCVGSAQSGYPGLSGTLANTCVVQGGTTNVTRNTTFNG